MEKPTRQEVEDLIKYCSDKWRTVPRASNWVEVMRIIEYPKLEKQYQYSDIYDINIDSNKVILNRQGGVDTYYVEYIKGSDKIGVVQCMLHTKVKNESEGKKYLMINGQHRTDVWKRFWNGDIPIHERSKLGISYLPQQTSIFRGLTVYENLLGIAQIVKKRVSEQKEIVE